MWPAAPGLSPRPPHFVQRVVHRQVCAASWGLQPWVPTCQGDGTASRYHAPYKACMCTIHTQIPYTSHTYTPHQVHTLCTHSYEQHAYAIYTHSHATPHTHTMPIQTHSVLRTRVISLCGDGDTRMELKRRSCPWAGSARGTSSALCSRQVAEPLSPSRLSLPGRVLGALESCPAIRRCGQLVN